MQKLRDKIVYNMKWLVIFLLLLAAVLIIIINLEGCKGSGTGGESQGSSDKNPSGGNKNSGSLESMPIISFDEQGQLLQVVILKSENRFQIKDAEFPKNLYNFLDKMGVKAVLLRLRADNSATARHYITTLLQQRGYSVSEEKE